MKTRHSLLVSYIYEKYIYFSKFIQLTVSEGEYMVIIVRSMAASRHSAIARVKTLHSYLQVGARDKAVWASKISKSSDTPPPTQFHLLMLSK